MHFNFATITPNTDEGILAMGSAANIQSISQEQLDALIQRVEHAVEHNLSIETADLSLLLSAIQTLAYLQSSIESQNTTLLKLRKLLGMVPSSEKKPPLAENAEASKISSKKKAKTRKPRKPSPERVPQRVEHYALEGFDKGSRCMACHVGTLARFEPAEFIRISGHSPLSTTKHVLERLRCNSCGELFTAELKNIVEDDGPRHQMYGYSARSMIAMHKYFAGTPFCRQQSLQQIFQTPVSASTQWDQCEALANACEPIIEKLQEKAAQGDRMWIDDSHFKILGAQPRLKTSRANPEKKTLRSGVYASCFLSATDDGEIVLFDIGVGHAGEFADGILAKRQPDKPPPNLMSDALSHNKVTSCSVIVNLCNAHARRHFIDIEASFPAEVTWLLERYQRIFCHDKQLHESLVSDQERLTSHKTHSLPIFEEIRDWCSESLNTLDSEHHNGLAKAQKYFLKHYDGLSAVCTQVGAQLDNNAAERALKLIIRNRKNSLFCQTEKGAEVTNIITSVIATAVANNINAFEYLTWLQRNRVAARTNPELFLPWFFRSVTMI